jgi:hypothetical protein
MIWHEAIGTDTYIPQFTGFHEEIDKAQVVFISGKSYFAPTTSIHNMIPGAWILYAQWSAHADALADGFK